MSYYRKIKRHRLIKNVSISLSIVYLFSSFAYATFFTIWSPYLLSFLGSVSLVGFAMGGLRLISFFSYFLFTPLIEKFHEKKVWIVSVFFSILFFLLFSFMKNTATVLIMAVGLVLCRVLIWESTGIILRDASTQKNIKENEGIKYALGNIGWVLGPLVAGFIAFKMGYVSVFICASILLLISLIWFVILNVKNYKHNTDDDKTVLSTVKNFLFILKNKELRTAYFLSGGVVFYWGIVYYFMPLYIINQGLSVEWIGLFLFAIAIPLIPVELVVGKIENKSGSKRFFIAGYFLVGLFALFAFFSNQVYLVLLFFVMASFGMALIESTQESHFFELIKKKDEEKYYGPFLTNYDLFGSIGKFSAGGIALISQSYVFLLVSIALFTLSIYSFTIKEKRKK